MGVISDTHGLLRPEAEKALRGASLILHAGDVGDPSILAKLREIAPVTAIRGNVDPVQGAVKLPFQETVSWSGLLFHLVHRLEDLSIVPKAAGVACVIFGHTHQPEFKEEQGVFFFNPGSAGPRRFHLPVTVGRIRVSEGRLLAEHLPLL
ncbi:MAG: metallophosphoesterase family protein [Verrucomicrobiae bacterium]|nr:metallophosphoesterase family protein [Verrucomicrobiae bacterium]